MSFNDIAIVYVKKEELTGFTFVLVPKVMQLA